MFCFLFCPRQVYSSLQIDSGTIRIKGAMRNDKSGFGTTKGNGMKGETSSGCNDTVNPRRLNSIRLRLKNCPLYRSCVMSKATRDEITGHYSSVDSQQRQFNSG